MPQITPGTSLENLSSPPTSRKSDSIIATRGRNKPLKEKKVSFKEDLVRPQIVKLPAKKSKTMVITPKPTAVPKQLKFEFLKTKARCGSSVTDLEDSLNFVCDRLLLKVIGLCIPTNEVASVLLQPESELVMYKDFVRMLTQVLGVSDKGLRTAFLDYFEFLFTVLPQENGQIDTYIDTFEYIPINLSRANFIFEQLLTDHDDSKVVPLNMALLKEAILRVTSVKKLDHVRHKLSSLGHATITLTEFKEVFGKKLDELPRE